jgi:predicted tellurium resistance membrane protein TerC
MIMRILLLLTLSAILGLTQPIVELTHLLGWLQNLGLPLDWLHEHPEVNEVSWRDLILFGGGLFLVGKSVHEIHAKFEGDEHGQEVRVAAGFYSVLAQIAVLDIIFSLDSVITAIGMAERIEVMVTAVIIAVVIMMIFAGAVSRFIAARPTLQVLALSFLLLIGVALIGDGLEMHIPKGYIYFAMAFSAFVETINLRSHRRRAA